VIAKTLGHYLIGEQLGRGGMGEVYRAHDPRVGRDVAIKVSSEQFTDRFAREIHAIALLNHPNIATLYDVGPNYLVMELVEGPTLEDRMKRGAIPLEEALAIAQQIADALEAAHEKGIVHRDLKPSNIKVRPDGTVKVLDFGLAKVVGTPTVSSESLPTLSLDQTQGGMILGTAAYMSPEQAMGNTVDKRADIWAFGVVIYEMLTGSQLFSGKTISDILAAVLNKEPDWGKAPPKARPMLRRCLEKDPKKRLRDIGEAMAWIENAPEAAPVRRLWFAWFWALLAMLLLLALALSLFLHFRGQEPSEARRFQISVPPMQDERSMAISPDGRWLAFVASPSGPVPYLFVQEIGSVTPRRIDGTEGANQPFWSADSRSIGFSAGNKLKRVNISSGLPKAICSVGTFAGGTWNSNGIILFSDFPVLRRISCEGGESTAITSLDASGKETSHIFPHFLPDGRHYLCISWSDSTSKGYVYLGSLDSEKQTFLMNGVSMADYSEPGYLLFQRGRELFAQPFDATKFTLAGVPTGISDNLLVGSFGIAAFNASQNGLLVYRSSSAQAETQFIWFDRDGKQLSLAGKPAALLPNFNLSPDGKQIAAVQLDAATANMDIWLLELERDVSTRLTYDDAIDNNPVWSPDGLWIGFSSKRKGNTDIFEKKVNGSEQEIPIVESAESKYLKDWSKDGKYIAYVFGDELSTDLGAIPLFGNWKPFPVVNAPSSQDEPHFSFDGKWLAYDSNESGTWQVYVVSFPVPHQIRQISTNGGAQPRWRYDGKELYYLALDGKMMAVDIKTDAKIEPGIPRILFDTGLNVDPSNDQYGVTPDGQHFLLLKPIAEAKSIPITVVFNWPSLLKK
jgi:eukaryotic-like serine/threonine-protein kinase